MQTPPLDSLLSSFSTRTAPIRLSGLTGTAQAWAILQTLRRLRAPLLILCPDEDRTSALYSDLAALSALIPCSEEDSFKEHLLWFPGSEPGLYSPISPPIRNRLARTATLGQLSLLRLDSNEREIPAVFTTAAAASIKTIPPDMLKRRCIRLERGKSCGSRDLLIRALLDSGYLRVDSTEDPGTFSARGEIIDLYTSSQLGVKRVVRIELFDDTIERIRPLDPRSQRTTPQELPYFSIWPCREVLVNSESVGFLRESIKSYSDEQGIHRSIRDPVIENISDGLYSERSELWAPFAYPDSTSLWGHLPPSTVVIVVDELSCQEKMILWRNEQNEDFQSLEGRPREYLSISPPPERALDLTTLEHSEIKARSSLIFSDLALHEGDTSSSDHHRFYVEPISRLSSTKGSSLEHFFNQISLWRRSGFKTLVSARSKSQAERLNHLLRERGESLVCSVSSLEEGFCWPEEKIAVLTERALLGRAQAKTSSRGRDTSANESQNFEEGWAGVTALSDLSPSDLIVHREHGIGKYQGLVRLNLTGAPADFLLIEYANNDKLYLPVYRLNLIQRHGALSSGAALDRLGSQQFQKTKAKVKESLKKLAIDLVRLYAERKTRKGFVFSRRDSLFEEFEANFPFEETPDQSKAIDAVLSDMEEGLVADRLICGDVGYGKTEVAMRAAYRAVLDGKQVAILVPTTLLAHQHEQSFRSRFLDLPVRVESISRFKSGAEQKKIIQEVQQGRVDIIVGTHRLLSKDISFKDLGLLVVDEEHRFGVEHKERLKTIKLQVPVITLTATPIPRTLQMSLSGIRDISLIRTPPVTRLPIKTFVSRREDSLIKKAIDFELGRGGQVFFVHNRVQSIYQVRQKLSELVPHAQITVAHGQMKEDALETAISEFYQKKTNLLICTSIIESGIDLPSANTIIIDRADSFGLAQLYQIRGRVGRGDQRGYAYLLIPPESAISDDAKKRLDVIQRFVELGSGFHVAAHDLEIRGGGDLLGPQQSGNIQAVGFDLYLELLEEAVQQIRSGNLASTEDSLKEPEIKAPFAAFLSEDFVPDTHQRLSLYRRLSGCLSDTAVDQLEEELLDRFGPLPEEANNLLWLIRTKVHLRRLKVDAITVGKERLSITPGKDSLLDPVRAISLVSAYPSRYQLTPDSRFVAARPVATMKDLYFSIQDLLKDLAPHQSSL